MRSLALALGLALFVALPAQANWDVKAKLTCYDDAGDTTKLPTFKGSNEEIVAACLGVVETHPSVAEHSLVFDSDFRELHVVRNCDALVVCDLSTQVSCATALDGIMSSYKLSQRCIYELLDIGPNSVFGSMICKESESWDAAKDKFTFKTSCSGNFDIDGEPCTLSFSSGKLFEESGSCPAS